MKEKLPTKDEIRAMEGAEFRNAHPFVKKNCAACKFCKPVLSLWCVNSKAIEYRGTAIPGIIFCDFWEPDWNYIPDKYKLPEFGYVEPPVVLKKKNWLNRLLIKLSI